MEAKNKIREFQNLGFKEQLRLEELEKERIRWEGQKKFYLASMALLIISIVTYLLYRNNLQRKRNNFILADKNRIISEEKQKSDALLLNILPREVAEELKLYGSTKAKLFENATVMFTDFKDFTYITESLSPEELVSEIDFCFREFDSITQKYNIEKIKTIGDSYMCVAGLPQENEMYALNIVAAAIEILQFIDTRNSTLSEDKQAVLQIRVGVHSGSVVAGIVGSKKFAYDIWGDTVNIASRMESSGIPGKINISAETYQLIKHKYNCVYRGKIHAKRRGI